MFELPNSRWYFTGFFCAAFATQVQAVAIGWHMFILHHRALDLGLVGLALFLPSLIFVFPAGALADHFDRRAIVIAAIFIELLCSLLFILFITRGLALTWPYFAVILLIGTARAFGAPAQRGMLINIVPRDGYLSAQAGFSSFRQIANVAGPAAGGALVAIGTSEAFLTSAILFSLAIAALVPLRLRSNIKPSEPPSLGGSLDALRFLRAHPVILGAILLDVCAVLVGGATALLPVYANVILKVGPLGLGSLRSAVAVGAGLSAIYLSRWPPARNIGRTLLLAVAVFGLSTIAFAYSRVFVVSLIALGALGGADMVSVVIRSGLVQLNTPDAIRGRVNAVENVFINASNELGAFESGTLASLIGSVPAVAVGGFATLAIVATWPFIFPALYRAKRFSV